MQIKLGTRTNEWGLEYRAILPTKMFFAHFGTFETTIRCDKPPTLGLQNRINRFAVSPQVIEVYNTYHIIYMYLCMVIY